MDQPAAQRYWVDWHRQYDVAGSSLGRRLAIVQRRVRQALDAQPPGEIRVLSMCAGQGRDILGVLADHARREDVVARLVELDPVLAADAERAARSAGLDGVQVRVGDAADTGMYEGVAPVNLALVCGVFGNLRDADVRHTVEQLPRLCRPGATVIWTRHRGTPDLTSTVRSWFADAGFEELGFDVADGFLIGVGTHRLVGPALPYEPGLRLFDFIGNGQDAHL
ncbi:class I SAM-dependent methyltransferase family protein [Frankia sp. CNm7]|uniref:Class I SAM-dependent methyltransferase family protein n=1 Tax=Frankia nepalensis TaxID=1836974 RepID=A0A937R708_9ACTN|nr:class I SAM-dependent methyltransferase family protein [Frankia nepalensis]MBL7494766.1 class I SAM-dependent methyltransferase family protein [Frankia nepalensis]MBL7514051.1 class I SAM-dependent methyltransferase family protein [Frankia nepalensis]MBL7518551.1 class I SAM-dependent methyltransferase family protein [Frankia nepalensis]MBL7626466.1 class I SAM-dependent methyltransferase family protein [Frankia nepalensis]